MCASRASWILGLTLIAAGCGASPDADAPNAPVELLDWSDQIEVREAGLEKRHEMLLPMMRRHGIDMWIVVNEEFHDDPLTEYVAPARPYTGRRRHLRVRGHRRRPAKGGGHWILGRDRGAVLRVSRRSRACCAGLE